MSARFVTDGLVACAALRWTGPRGAYLTLVATATVIFDRDGATLDPRPGPPSEFDRGDGGVVSDLAPYLPRGEVVVRRSQHVAANASSSTRLAVLRGGTRLLDKRLPAGPRAAFGYGAIARTWPQRQDLLRPGDVAAWDAPAHTLLEGFPLAYFQTAPADQQIAGHFTGAETIVLEGLVPGAESVQWQLPSIRVEARRVVEGRDGSAALPMQLDTIRIDGEAGRASLLWRGYQGVGADDSGDVPVFAVGVALRGAAVVWPTHAREDGAHSGSSTSAPGPTVSPLIVDRPVAPYAMKAPGPPRRTPSPPGGAALPWSAAAKSARVEPARAGQHATLQHLSAMPDLVAGAGSPETVSPPGGRAPDSPRIVLSAPAEVETGGRVELVPGLGSALLVAFAQRVLASPHAGERGRT